MDFQEIQDKINNILGGDSRQHVFWYDDDTQDCTSARYWQPLLSNTEDKDFRLSIPDYPPK